MFTIGALGFTAPLLLTALLALPVLWLLLRAVPPAPVRRRFPGVALLLGLQDQDNEADRTPWWLLLLRLLAIALIILGFAGPVWDPSDAPARSGPLVILSDGNWANAADWANQSARAEAELAKAYRAGRAVALVSLTDLPAQGVQFRPADSWGRGILPIEPQPYMPDPVALQQWLEGIEELDFETYWLSGGIDFDGRDAVLQALLDRGPVRVVLPERTVIGLQPVRYEDGALIVAAARAESGIAQTVQVIVRGTDPSGQERELDRVTLQFSEDAVRAQEQLVLPSQLRNRITGFEIENASSAASTVLVGDSLRRRTVGLISGQGAAEALELLSPLHYLRQALTSADVLELDILEALSASPDVMILADVARLGPAEEDALSDWISDGGMLVRFAGPRLAASSAEVGNEAQLLPVPLRSGGRSVGGAMSWGAPKTLAPFPEGSPFFGLPIPDEVTVTSQVLAQPDVNLPERTIAALQDGTPLVTRMSMGAGQVILFHVTANAEWSSLPLSGLYVQMLERLAIASGTPRPDSGEFGGTVWTPTEVLTGFGQLGDPSRLRGVPGELLAEGRFGPHMPPGVYSFAERSLALNVMDGQQSLAAISWPTTVTLETASQAAETILKGPALLAALLLLCADVLAALLVSGKFGRRSVATAALLISFALPFPEHARAQNFDLDRALRASSEVVLAHVKTGDASLDAVTFAGLQGLSQVLYARTAIEPGAPEAVDVETDELSFYPLIYWNVSADQPLPTSQAYARLNAYLRNGGMILFDTRDADISRFGQSSPEAARLQILAQGLDIPPLETVPRDHVLTRSFYLLAEFPGRHLGRDVWVEAAPEEELVPGMPFRNLNDGVTPVVIGGNDWASAWAVDEQGRALVRLNAGLSGERQREIAYRFGVNLMMHVLTGNYKSDQVHVPALLDRLGN